jgi:multiple sugar transport system permease protein
MGTQAIIRKRSVVSYKTRRRLVPYFYMAPATFLFILLMLYPMITVFRYSLMDGAITKRNPSFVGFENYVTNFENPVFWQAVGQTLYFTSLSVIFHLMIGMAFALLLNSPLVNPVIRSILRTLYVLPWLFTAVIIAIIGGCCWIPTA